MVCSYSLVSNLVPYINLHVFAPVGQEWIFQPSHPFCYPEYKHSLDCPTIFADVQCTVTCLLSYNYPKGSYLSLLTSSSIPLLDPYLFGIICNSLLFNWVPSAGSMCVPGAFWNRIFPFLYEFLLWTSDCLFLKVSL